MMNCLCSGRVKPSLGVLAVPITTFSVYHCPPGHLRNGPLVAVVLLSSPAFWSVLYEPGVQSAGQGLEGMEVLTVLLQLPYILKLYNLNKV